MFFLLLLIPITVIFFTQFRVWQARAAATIFWDGGGDATSWSDPLNWNTDVVPVPADDVLIDTVSTVSITEPITINSLVLGKVDGSVATVLQFEYDAITLGALTLTGGDLTVYYSANITHKSYDNVIPSKVNIDIQTGDAFILGSINVGSRGYGPSLGPGQGTDTDQGAGGGAYGGNGGNGQNGHLGGTAYGSYTNPTDYGSGGGIRSGYSSTNNGGGAIKLTVAGVTTVNGSIAANGGYGDNSSDRKPGGGSGGSILINTGTLAGTGNITANGGNTSDSNYDGGGGGGGRIAIYYGNNSSTLTTLTAKGGRPGTAAQYGGAGTIYMKSTTQTNGDLILDNAETSWNTSTSKVALTPLPDSLTLDNLKATRFTILQYASTLTVYSTLEISYNTHFTPTSSVNANTINIYNNASYYNQLDSTTTYTLLNWGGGILFDNGGTMNIVSNGNDLLVPSGSTLYGNVARTFANLTVNGTLTHSLNGSTLVYRLNYTVPGNVTVNSGGQINVDARGYSASQGPGQGVDTDQGAGGGAYGGNGGIGQNGHAGGTGYGSYKLPTELGSGGGLRPGYSSSNHGGGAVQLTVGGTTNVIGTISANGGYGDNGSDRTPGGGAGGSILIDTTTLTGTGIIRANGGNAYNTNYDGGGGGGGRIALYFNENTSNLATLTANGGRPGYSAQFGGAGTVYIKDDQDVNGDLIIASNDETWDTSLSKVAITPLTTNITIDNLTVYEIARIEYSNILNVVEEMNLSYNVHFKNLGTVNANILNFDNNAWYYNELGSTTTYNNLNWTTGILTDNGGTMNVLSSGSDLIVPSGSTLYGNVARTFANLTVNGTLTHSLNGSTLVYRLNYTVPGNVIVNSGGQINVDSKGYSAGQGPGQGVDTDRGAGGGAYGGNGGIGQEGHAGGTGYGSYTLPTELGSGGGLRPGYSASNHGGGAIQLTVGGATSIYGTVSANGGYADNGSDRTPGGGAGGSILINTTTLTGTGIIRANGGNAYNTNYDGGGGGGGRIALYFDENTSNLATLTANGGRPGYSAQFGGAGTVYIKDDQDVNGDLIIASNDETWDTSLSKVAITPLTTNITIDNLTVYEIARIEYSNILNVVEEMNLSYNVHFKNLGTVNANILNFDNNAWYYNELGSTTTYNNLNWTTGILTDNGGTMNVLSSGSDLIVPSGSTLYGNAVRTFSNLEIGGVLSHYSNGTETTYRINYDILSNFTILPSGSINIDIKGFASSQGPGQGVDTDQGAGGAGHGGSGGRGQNGAAGGGVYGDELAPTTLGSGGGIRPGYASNNQGGGAVKLTVGGLSTIDGTISANGGYGDNGSDRTPGGGAGGSIWIITDTLSGSGIVRADGGSSRNWNYDGGGGGGGRIAFYYSQDNSTLTALTVNGGTAGSGAVAGSPGTIFLGGIPTNPINMTQKKTDNSTGISIGGITNESSFIASLQASDANDSDTLIAEIEIQPLGIAFNNIATHTGLETVYSGTPVNLNTTIDGLADTTEYHWQSRVCDTTNLCSDWVSAGNNTEAEADIRVVLNTAPNSPTIPSSSYYIDRQYTNYLQPTFDFVLTDPNTADGIGYQIQIDTTVEFTTVILDYISAVGAQGVQSFTVGQAVGEGTYNTGAQDQELVAGGYYWRVKSIDSKGAQSEWSTAAGEPPFIIDLSKPSNASNTRMKSHVEGLNEYTESEEPVWFNRNDLYFEWDSGSDQQGVKGYCLYLGQDIAGNPATEKGLLGTSPISTTGTTCDFITADTSIDFANSALRSYEWLTSSNQKYYFKVKTVDIANNIYEGPEATSFVSFKFDNTPPQNVSSISAPSSTFSSTADMYFTWPISESNGGSDLHSQLLGFQYALNTRDTWYGDLTDETTGLVYKSLDSEQPFYLPQNIRNLIQLGQNVLYFRILDNAGNVSELRTVNINYGGEAPKFAEGEQVTVTPTQNNENRFAFSWPDAIVSEGNELETYYYMINTPPPMSYATITSNSATYRAIDGTTLAQAQVSGLRKGANTIYVVAVDKAHNYSPTNTISATFFLNTELPDPPTNLIIADSSIKDVSMWRAALIWDEPVYKGTGDLTYTLQRSEDGETWETVKTTTGLAHIDTVPESKAYYWRVGTMDNSDESILNPSYSNAVTIIPRGKYTSPPTLTSGPAASSITTTKATISWTTNRNADSKIAFGLASGNYLEWEPSISTHTTEHLIPLSNLTPGTDYFFRAKWTDEDGNTGQSDEKIFSTQPPPEVKEVRISNLGISSTIINFTTKNASKVKIYYGTSTSFGGVKEIGTSKLETTYSVEIDRLEDGTKYFYQINTFDEEGEEYAGTILDFQTLPRPRVSNVLVQQVAKTAESTLLVTWESNTKVSSIVTFYPEKNPELMQDIVELDLVQGEHKMLIKGLLPDTSYIIKVRGRDVIGNEAESENIKVTTSSDSRPPQISAMNIEGTNILHSEGTSQSTSSQLIVTWTSDEAATSQVEYGEGSGKSYSQLTQEDKNLSFNHVVIISGLTPSKVYHLRAISKDGAGNESKSIDTVTITPKATDSAFYLVVTTLQEAFNFLGDIQSGE